MAAVYFYHMTRSPLEVTLPVLLHKSLAAGWRVVVRARAPDRLAWLDEKLWLGPEEQFLAHGLAGGSHDADQPVLLTSGAEIANGAACLMAVDGAEIGPDEVAGLERGCILFDGNDPASVEQARAQWRALTGAGIAAQYWSQQSGHWEKSAESH